ncbi:ABC transporter substrate-binding protein [Paenibacillus xerothermodurans]|uniref:Sugar ABC transporter substrate-binding protein n=1 Tax=Paenibacillus xerothermodurans TaxID=1977292 RepID=A0A2W1P1L5_PAEXE|nr:extracellular solute-binding protein [Paenibacillus xerothermodurans]PZE21642.1 sugar ABC transporter substrate-binding protein [Paenibacillus xerothermodurans]
MLTEKRSKAALSIVSTTLLAAMVGCSSDGGAGQDGSSANPQAGNTSSNGKVELRIAWWGSQDRHDRTLKAIELYEQQNPNVKLTAEFIAWDGYWDKLATQAAGKNLPDIIQQDYKYVNEYVARDLLVDLNPYVQSNTIDLRDADHLHTDGGKINNKLYAVNLGTNSLAIAYDPAMFAQAGVPELKPGYTWDDLAAAARQLKSKLGSDAYGMPNFNSMDPFKHLLREKGLWLYNEQANGLGYDNDQILVDYFKYFDALLKDGVVPTPQVTQDIKGLEDELIVHKKSPMHFFNSNQVVALQKAANRPLKLTILPDLPGGTKGHFLKPSQFFSITKHSKHPEEAAKFINFFTNDLKANEILGAERGVPISSKVREHLGKSMGDAAKEMFGYIELAQQHAREIHPPDPEGSSKIEALFARIQEAVNYGELTPEQAAKQFREEGTKELQKK